MSDVIEALPPDLVFLQWLIDANGYRDPRPIGGGRYACIMPFMQTHAIITGQIGDEFGFENRWCYHDYRSAKRALDAWGGQGEPEGWHRHPASGRRLSEAGDESFDEDGIWVPIGSYYLRA